MRDTRVNYCSEAACVLHLVTFDLLNSFLFTRSTFVSTVLSETGFLFLLNRYSELILYLVLCEGFVDVILR